MSDILLLLSPISYTNPLANCVQGTYPVGMAYITTVLKNAGISVRAIDNSNARYSIQDLLDIIAAENVKLVGFSQLFVSIPSTVKLARAIKARFGNKVHILLGNAYASIDPSILQRYDCFDSAVAGEAENMIVEYVRRVLAGDPVAGVVHAEAPTDLDAIPFPVYSNIENVILPKGAFVVPMVGTRGCPYLCGYCARQALSRKVRNRSADNIIAEMKGYLHLTREFYFQDDSATINRQHIVSLCDGIIRQKMDIRFEMTTRIDLIDDEMVQLLKKAGCKRFLVGVESGSERIRQNVIKKHLSNEAIYKGLAIANRNKMPVQLMFMLGHPEETEADIMETVNMPLLLEKMGFRLELVGYHITFLVPATPYFDWYVKQGKISPTVIDDFIEGRLGDGFFGYWPYLIPNGFTLDDMVQFRKMATRQFYLRPGYIFRKALADLSSMRLLLEDIKNLYYICKYGASADLSKIKT